ncbi:phage tail protein [Thalassospira sp. TSL5-1]|uniref:phage tail protein n=1 Tax=Thalassospira sp. TSL5-1 TaxID=1544451 RepID=UPI00093B5456|nr:tail fiber protein [Thalassospira sp. TSL5-1]
MKTSLKQISPAACLSAFSVFLLAVSTIPGESKASGCPTDQVQAYIGSVCWTAANHCPQNAMPADGRILSIENNKPLYGAISNRFGGDGTTTFALPDVRGRTIAGTGKGNSIPPVALGQSYGAESVSLTADNLPPHAHLWKLGTAEVTGTLKATTTEGNSISPDNRVLAARPSSGIIRKKMPLYGASPDARLGENAATVSSDPETARTNKTGQATPGTIPIRPPQEPLLACIITVGISQ